MHENIGYTVVIHEHSSEVSDPQATGLESIAISFARVRELRAAGKTVSVRHNGNLVLRTDQEPYL